MPINDFYNICRVQQDATNFDFRKRHYEMKRAKEELEYQMKTVSLNIFGFHFITHSSLGPELDKKQQKIYFKYHNC